MRHVAQLTHIQGWWVLDKHYGRYGRVVVGHLDEATARRRAAELNA